MFLGIFYLIKVITALKWILGGLKIKDYIYIKKYVGNGNYEFKQYSFNFHGILPCGKKVHFFHRGKMHTRKIRKIGTDDAYVTISNMKLYLRNYLDK